MGIDDAALNWISNYLKDRRQRVVVDGSTSDWKLIKAGVPQGSVLGPLLLLVYINDLPDNIRCGIKIFADDTTLFVEFNRENAQEMNSQLQNDILELERWAERWLVTFNPSKTKCVHICPRNAIKTTSPLVMCNEHIEHSSSHGALGLEMNEEGRWNKQIDSICTNGNRKVNMLYPLKNKVDRETIHRLIAALVRPTLEYACIVWDNCTSNEKKQIDRVYENSLRLVTGAPRWCKIESLYDETSEIRCQIRRDKQKLIFMHKIVHKNAPEYILGLVQRNQNPRPGHEYDVIIPHSNTSHYKDTYIPTASVQWNQLPYRLKSINNEERFKRQLNIEPKFRKPKPNTYFKLGDRKTNIILGRIR